MSQPTGWQTRIERRRDWARDAEQVFWLGAAVVTAWVGWRVASAVIGPVTAQVPAPALGITAVAGSLPLGAQLDPVNDKVTVVLATASAGQMLLAVLAAVPQPLVLAAVLAMLAQWARSVRRGATFTAAAASRLTRVGRVATAAGIAAWFLQMYAVFAISDAALPHGVAGYLPLWPTLWSLAPALWWPLGGACLGLIGEVVRRGVALRDELEGVI